MTDAIVTVVDVKAAQTRSGNTRFVLTDERGREFTTFKEPIARQAFSARGRQARIQFHETQRNGFTNVYLDAVEPLDDSSETGDHDAEASEIAWRTALEAAPYLLSPDAVEREVPPDELFEKLKPLKDLVADDIRRDDEGKGTAD